MNKDIVTMLFFSITGDDDDTISITDDEYGGYDIISNASITIPSHGLVASDMYKNQYL